MGFLPGKRFTLHPVFSGWTAEW